MRTFDVPLWSARVASLFMAWVWAIIAFGVDINALVKSNRDKDNIRRLAPQGAMVDIDTDDVFQTGAVMTAISVLIFVITTLYLIILLARPTSFTRPGIVSIQAGILAFCAVWLFATLVPYTHFFRTRSAIVRVAINGTPLSPTIISTLGRQLGISPEYRHLSYLRLVAILPWFTLLFTIIASVILYMTAARFRRSPISSVAAVSSEDQPHTPPEAEIHEKPSTEKTEA